jgi:ABC-type antimicrobial peptide transport system permease subunit
MSLAVAACTAVMVGALAVGDSMRHSLRTVAEQRVGPFQYALFTGERFFREALALETGTVPLLSLQGIAANDDGSRRLNAVSVLGVDARFGAMAPATGFPELKKGEVALNGHLARKLGVRPGEEVVVRVPRIGLPGELALVSDKEMTLAFRATVRRIVGDDQLGRFSLGNTQVPPLNVYVPLTDLQDLLARPGQANMLLAGRELRSLEQVNAVLGRAWALADMGLTLGEVPGNSRMIELRSQSVFLDAEVSRAALAASTQAVGVLSYLVNSISAQGKSTPYSFVAGLPATRLEGTPGSNEIVITDWLAEDLGVAPGAELTLRYFVLGAMRSMIETGVVFRVAQVVPLKEGADPTLMPAIPGLSDSGSCREWESGVPIDLQRIRPKDEAYWDAWRGAPKAFINLESARGLWSNRWGSLTAVRYPAAGSSLAGLEAAIKADPGRAAPAFKSLRGEAARAWSQAMDFGQLFLGLSLFLVISTILMMAYLFRLSVEQRLEQTGLLLALGLGRNQVRRWFMAANLLVAVPGGLLGLAAGSLYAAMLLHWFETLWQPAGSLLLQFEVEGRSLGIAWGVSSGLALAMGWLTPWRIASRPVRALLDSWEPRPGGAGRRWLRRLCGGGMALALAVVALTAWMGRGSASSSRVEYFLLTGLGLLALGIAAMRWFMEFRAARPTAPRFNRAGLARRNADRKPARSVLISGMVACAVFLLVIVELFQPYEAHPRARASGTGGFALMMETAVPSYVDLNQQAGRKTYGLPQKDMEGVRFLGFRVRPGDDAGCRNLSRAQEPRLLGVNADVLGSRGTFTFLRTLGAGAEDGVDGWSLLETGWGMNVVPAVADETTLMWGLEKSVGDELSYVDESGRPFQVRFVGMLANSVLQGSVMIPERDLQERYPSLAGESLFLIDVPEGRERPVADLLGRRLQDLGAAVTECPVLLADLGAVTVLYLKLFQTLGGLGLLLGVVVVALVVIRNAFERRGELAVLRAVGFSRSEVMGLLVEEQVWLMVWGMAVGVGAALAAVGPAIEGRALGPVLWPGLTGMLAGVVTGGLLASVFAAWAVTRSTPLEALREE